MTALLLFLHLIGACIWVGGHLILVFVIIPEARKLQSPEYLFRFERNYEIIGIPALFIQLITGALLFFNILPVSDFTIYHPVFHKLIIKLVLLILTFGLAFRTRFYLLKNLTAEKLPVLQWHVAAVTVISILFVIAGLNFKYELY